MDLTGAEDIKKRWQEYTGDLHDLHDPDNHDGVIADLEPDILESEVKWTLGTIYMNKTSGGNGIPGELFQILKDDAVKVLYSICQQIWKTLQLSKYHPSPELFHHPIWQLCINSTTPHFSFYHSLVNIVCFLS